LPSGLAATLPGRRAARYRFTMSPRCPPIITCNDIEASGSGSGSDLVEVGVAIDAGYNVFEAASRLGELPRGCLGCDDDWMMGWPWLDRLHEVASMRGEFIFSTRETLPESQTAAWADIRQALLAGRQEPHHWRSYAARVVRETVERTQGAGDASGKCSPLN
jgi:hypothetical protein